MKNILVFINNDKHIHEIVNIEFWCDMPDYPEIEEA